MAATDWASVQLPSYTDLVAALWPVLLFDVLVSDASERRLNLAQEAVLDMMRLGLRDRWEIGRRLQLDPDLVEIVVGELVDEDYLDDQLLPTDLAVMDAEARTGLEWSLRTGFQDPFTGRLWPVATGQVHVAPLEWRGDARVIVFSNSTKRLECVEFNEFGDRPEPPSPRDVVDAMEGPARPGVDDAENEGSSNADLRIETISDTGRLAWAPVVLLLPSPPDDIDGVSALGIDGRPGRLLLDAISRAAVRDQTAQRIRLRLDQRARDAKLGPYREYVDRVRADAEDEVERLLGQQWTSEPELWAATVDLRSRVLEINQDPTRAGAILAGALIAAGVLLEQVGRLMALSRPLPEAIAEQLDRNGRSMKKKNQPDSPVIAPAVAGASETWAAGLLPDALPGSNHNGESRRPTGAYWHWARAVTAAHYDEQHGLRLLLRQEPNWLLRMAPINALRNKAAHVGREGLDLTQGVASSEEALQLAVQALQFIDPPGGRSHGSE